MTPESRLHSSALRNVKLALKAKFLEARKVFVKAFMSYSPDQLLLSLRSMGVQSGDTLMLHSAFGAHHGFRGTVEELTNVFLEAVGPGGNLLMVSLPYRSSTLDYLSHSKQFDVRKTPSMMGLVSEYFRRRTGVLRSLHPTHPVLAMGASAEWIVAGHENCLFPCGPDSPFDRLAALDGKAVFFNVPIATLTFFHYLEHQVRADLPIPVYLEAPITVPVIDQMGELRTVTTFVFSPEAIKRRRFEILEGELRHRRSIQERRLGNTRIAVVKVRDTLDCVEAMRSRGQYFYDLAGLSEQAPGLSRID